MVQFNFLSFVLAASAFSSSFTQAQQNATPSFDEIIATDGNLTALNGVLMLAGLNISDEFPDAITLFAPNDAAFAAASALTTRYGSAQYIAHLQNILLLHVVPAAVLSTELMDGEEVEAANGETITVAIDGNAVTISTVNSTANVVAVNIASSDGVIHQIDAVLEPAFLSTSLVDLTGSVDGFSILLKLLISTGLADIVGPNTTATVFAPTDEAFMALPDGALEYYQGNQGIVAKLLSGHVISPQIIPTQLMESGPLPYETPAGTTLMIEVEEVDGEMVYKVDGATIGRANVLANNGIIHSLGSVLSVPGAEYPPNNSTTPTAPTPSTPSQPTAPTRPTAPTPTRPTSSASKAFVGLSLTSIIGWFLMA